MTVSVRNSSSLPPRAFELCAASSSGRDASVGAPPIVYSHDGKEYVVVLVGGSGLSAASKHGDSVYAFALGSGSSKLNEAPPPKQTTTQPTKPAATTPAAPGATQTVNVSMREFSFTLSGS